MKENFYAGVSVLDITPKIGGQLFGYRPDIFSKAINDKLTLSSIFISDTENDILLVSASLCLISTELSVEIRGEISRKTGIAFENIILSSTHTHSAPNVCGIYGWGNVDRKYCDEILIPKAVESAINAKTNVRKTLVGTASVLSNAGVNRRYCDKNAKVWLAQAPWEAFDGNMTVIAFKEPSGELIASIVHYGMHATCAGQDPVITRDWVGVMSDILQKATKAPVLFFNGAEGDVGPRLSNGKTVGNINDIYETGAIAGFDAVKAYNKIKHFRYEKISILNANIRLKLGDRIPLELAVKSLEKIKSDSINIDGRKADYYKRTIDSYKNNMEPKKDFIINQTLISIGNIVIIPMPFEVFSDISLRLREYSNFEHTLCFGISNGHNGYLPSQTQICRGGYEVDFFKTESVWPFLDNTDDNIISEILKLMEEL